MSGPATTTETELQAGAEDVATQPAVEISESRTSEVGALEVRRALPQRHRRTIGAWCFVDHAGPVDAAASGAGIGPHPHIGLQTVTWLLSGEILHRDSLGTEQLIRPGQLNLMTAGRGVAHAEEHTSADGQIHLVQMWVAQPEATRDGAPAFEHHAELPRIEFGESTAMVLVGALGDAASPARRDTDHMGAQLDVRGDAILPTNPAFEYGLISVDGVVSFDGQALAPGSLAYLGPGRDELALRAAEGARVILVGGVPFAERVKMWWNYVARTRDEIETAHQEWTARGERFASVDSRLDEIDVGPPPWSTGG